MYSILKSLFFSVMIFNEKNNVFNVEIKCLIQSLTEKKKNENILKTKFK